MFWRRGPSELTLESFCRQQFGADAPLPNLRLMSQLYNSGDLSAASNIILSNGLMDPWSSGTCWLCPMWNR